MRSPWPSRSGAWERSAGKKRLPATCRLASVALLIAATACMRTPPRSTSPVPPAPDQMAELWIEPTDLETRDLFHGPGNPELVPDPDVVYVCKGLDTKGHSRGYDVEDPKGRRWDVKVGTESQTEIVVSRFLWAIGYHQPVMYHVPRWKLTGGPTDHPKPGRFRLASDHKSLGEWAWHENPFAGTRPFRGLVVANLVLNQWDFKTSNNRVYRPRHASQGPARWYVVQDIGSALGKTRLPVGTRDNIEQFESQDLVLGVENNVVKFDYHTRHKFLLADITPDDVVWSCRLLSRLSDRQMQDAFRAAGYPDDLAARYIRKIRQKIQQGLALETRTRDRS